MASSTNSMGGSRDTTSDSLASTFLETGQNAISTLLQPPIVRTGLVPHSFVPSSSDTHKPPTARDIPPVILTNIPHVDAADFKPYLNQVGAIYVQLQRAKEGEDEEVGSLHGRKSTYNEFDTVFNDGHLRPGNSPLAVKKNVVFAVSSISPAEEPSPIRRSSTGFARRATKGPPLLSTVPSVYFDAGFRLENPRTFDVVSERSEVVRNPGTLARMASASSSESAPRKALATNAILQEKLSWYMDTIETYLIASLSTASTAFFTALGSLRELHSATADSVERVKALRKELTALHKEIAISGLNIVQKQQRRENLRQLHDAILQLKHVVEGVATCESFIDDGNVEKALESVDSVEKLIIGDASLSKASLIAGEGDLWLRDIRGVTALGDAKAGLSTLRSRIGKVYETRFLSLLMGDLRLHADAVSPQEVLMRWASASMRSRGGHIHDISVFPSYMSTADDLQSELLESLTGLHRTKYLTSAVTAYREAVQSEIRNLVRRSLPSSNYYDNESMMSSSSRTRRPSLQQKSSILAQTLRALGPEDAEELLIKICIGVTETLRRLTTQLKLLLDVASSLGVDSYSSSDLRSHQMESPVASTTGRRSSIAGLEAQDLHKVIDLQELLGQAVDAAQGQIVEILRIRSEQSTHLSLTWFLRYFTLNLYFANECESISGRSGTEFRTIVNWQIKDFVEQHGDTEKQKLAQGMASDQWEAKDFSEENVAELNRILCCSIKDPAEWSDGFKIWIPYSDDESESGKSDDPQPTSDGGTRTRNASINGETFVLPKSAILCMDGLAHFLQLITAMPSMTSHIGAELVSYLQLFNSRCKQLILGAAAKRSAGLQSITSKHLALTSQALAFIAALISRIRECVRRHAGSGAAAASSLVEFDNVKRLYQEHGNSIYDKIVEIMSRLAASHVKAMKNIDWDDGQENVHAYMVALVRDTTSLHRILTKTLPEGPVSILMVPIFVSYKDQFGKAFREVDSKTELGWDSILHDIEFFKSKLGKVDGCSGTGEYLKGIIKPKQVKCKRLAAANVEEKETEDTKD